MQKNDTIKYYVKKISKAKNAEEIVDICHEMEKNVKDWKIILAVLQDKRAGKTINKLIPENYNEAYLRKRNTNPKWVDCSAHSE